MSRPASRPQPAPPAFAVHAWSRTGRATAATLVAVSRGALPLLLVDVLLASDPPVTPPILLIRLGVWSLLPALAAATLRRTARATLDVGDDLVVIEGRSRRVEVPRDAIAAVEPWRLPLPGAGFALRLRSGRTLGWSVEAPDPEPLLAALGAERARQRTAVRWAHARAGRPRRWWQVAARYPLWALPFGLLFFYTHQHIAYGAFRGQWLLEGFGPWLRTLLVYWVTTTMYCVLWASVCRGGTEAIAWAVASVAPAHAARGRRAAEWIGALAYFGGMPAFTASRFLA